MKRKSTPIIYILLVMILVCSLSGCTFVDMVRSTLEFDEAEIYTAESSPASKPEKVRDLTIVVTAEDIAQLEEYPDLKRLDLTGSTCYAEIMDYMEAHPDVEVTYTVDIAGVSHPSDTEELDLSALTAAELQTAAESLQYFPALTKVNLMKEDGTSNLSKADVKTLMDAAPEVPFHYTFDFYGKTLGTNVTYAEYVDVMMGDEAEAELREALDIMPKCYAFILDNCGFSSPVLDQVNKDYPDTKIVWRVFFGTSLTSRTVSFTCRTDEELIRATGTYSNELRDDSIGEMKYLTEVKYMDIGHNDKLSDISFTANMPNLELVILSGSVVKDLSPLTNCQNLEYLELVYCTRLSDLTPLAECKNLKFLNVSFTAVSDLDCLYELPLERFNCLCVNKMQWAEKEAFAANMPNCMNVFNGSQPYGYGWRYEDYGYTFYESYANMRLMFNYENVHDYTGYGYKGKKL